MACKRGHCFKVLTVAAACGLMTGFFSSCSTQAQITTPSATIISSMTTQRASQNPSKLTGRNPLPNYLYTNILNGNTLTLSGLGHDNHSEGAINQLKTLNKIAGMLKFSVPYNKDIPQSTLPGDCANDYTNDYIGPVYLTVMLKDKHQVQIQPYVYYTIDRSNPQAVINGHNEAVITRHYVNNLIEVSDNGNHYYALSQDLFDWFQNKCRVEFNTYHAG